MELYQVSIFGERQKVIKKDNTEYKPKPLNKKGRELKHKLVKLYKIYEAIYDMQNVSILEQREIIKKGDIIVYVEERQAEPIETINMNTLDDIDKRLEIAQEKYEQLQFDFMKELQCNENR